MKTRDRLVWLLLVAIGTLQIGAEALGMARVKALAAALQLSPAMKVFTAHQGYETHAARFSLSWVDDSGASYVLALDPATYSHVQGPYNRRNVYGAAFAYGPLLRADPQLRTMQESVMRYALCDPGTLREELGISRDAHSLVAHVAPVRPVNRADLELSWPVRCDE
ncbi:MAG TPA: hypothetical protein VFO82_08725 [Steroidobacteraceae bacterium]|nr:hypothetical protein [Steroidobacteraceae bacterium]